MIAYLACELNGRDLDSRILIAAHLCQAGAEVIVGNLWGIVANLEKPGVRPPGVVLFATANKIQARLMEAAKFGGHLVITTNEEALAITDESHLLATFSAEAMAVSDFVVFQHRDHEKIVKRSYPACRGAVLGNARVDLLQNAPNIYRDEIKRVRAGGRYILLNTSFTIANTIWNSPQEAVGAAAAGGVYNLEDPAALAELQKEIDEEARALHSTLTLIEFLKRDLPGFRIVVRPHPAEKAETWEKISGIEVVAKSRPAPWMLGASLLIHINSTTGLEAAISHVPCLNLGTRKLFIMDKINCVEPDPAKAAATVREFLLFGSGPLQRHANPSLHYPKGAAARIAEKALQLGKTLPNNPITAWGSLQRDDKMKEKITVSLEEFLQRAKPIIQLVNGLRINAEQIDDTMFLLRRRQ